MATTPDPREGGLGAGEEVLDRAFDAAARAVAAARWARDRALERVVSWVVRF